MTKHDSGARASDECKIHQLARAWLSLAASAALSSPLPAISKTPDPFQPSSPPCSKDSLPGDIRIAHTPRQALSPAPGASLGSRPASAYSAAWFSIAPELYKPGAP